MVRVATLLGVAGLLLIPGTAAAVAPPVNDNFPGETVALSGLPLSVTGNTAEAGIQGGEPGVSAGNRTVWYSFTPASSTHVFIGPCTNPATQVGSLYTGGAVNALTVYSGGSDAIECPGASNEAQAIGYNLVGGTTYRYQLKALTALGSAFDLRFFLTTATPTPQTPAKPHKKCKKGRKLKKGRCVKKKRKK